MPQHRIFKSHVGWNEHPGSTRLRGCPNGNRLLVPVLVVIAALAAEAAVELHVVRDEPVHAHGAAVRRFRASSGSGSGTGASAVVLSSRLVNSIGIGPARPARLSRLRHPRPWLRASSLSGLRVRAARRLLLQGLDLPLLHYPAHGGRRRPPRQERPPHRAGAAVGPLLPTPLALPRRARPALASRLLDVFTRAVFAWQRRSVDGTRFIRPTRS